ncbi:MAG: DNA-binding protein WhiA [Anaerotruncus sp.]|nr:DNA-binding protein WhiA [Anaerotruncus sp.]
MPSFAYRIKSEICSNRPLRQRYKKALAYGLLLFGKGFGIESISIHTENRAVARLYADSISDLVGLQNSITVREIKRADRCSIYVVTVDSIQDRIAILSYFGCRMGQDCCRIRVECLQEQEVPAFLSGVFLAAGTVSDPKKSYRVEFAVSHKPLCDDLKELLSQVLATPKETVRRNDYLLYYKESEHIEDLLTYIGAAKSALDLMEVKIVKGLRNRVNRATNCETANISKTIDAAVPQVESIRYIEQHGGIDQLPEDLRELARLRLENADLSLRELGGLLSEPLSRSGVNHRLKRILEFAQELHKKN